MSDYLALFWQFNIEISLLLLVTLVARYALRKSTKVYNAYLLWLSIPVGLLLAAGVSHLEFSTVPAEPVSAAIVNYAMVAPSTADNWLALGYVWFLITALLLLRLVYQHLNLRKDLRAIEANTTLDLQSQHPVIAIDKPGFSPAVYGFFTPRIYFPVHLLGELSDQQLALIIEHEQHHIKQQHLWLNLLWDVLVCVLWFNPFVYLSRQGFRHDQELYCDYLVLYKSNKQSQHSYGHALLSTVSATHSVSLLCSWKTFNQLEERIMNIKNPSSLASKSMLLTFGAAIITCTSLYAVSAEKAAKQKVVIEVHEDEDQNAEKSILKINRDGKSFVIEDGKRYVLEDSQSREMTSEEAEQFDREIFMVEEKIMSKHHGLLSKGEARNKQIRIFRSGDGKLSEQEWEEIHESIREVEIEIEQHHDEFAMVQFELEAAHKEIEEAHKAEAISAKAMRKAQKKIESTQMTLEKDKERMRQSLEQARAQMKSLRVKLTNSE